MAGLAQGGEGPALGRAHLGEGTEYVQGEVRVALS